MVASVIDFPVLEHRMSVLLEDKLSSFVSLSEALMDDISQQYRHSLLASMFIIFAFALYRICIGQCINCIRQVGQKQISLRDDA